MFKEKLKALTDTEKEVDNKKKIESLIVFVIILVITIIAINSIWKGEKSNKNTTNIINSNLALANNEANLSNNNLQRQENLDENLENILSSISGVGKVNVFINYSESSTLEAMYNETKKESSTEETDTEGGVRTIQQTDTQKDIIYSEESGSKSPVTQKIINPTIEGAIITAEGAGDSTTKSNIIDAVSAVTGLPVHKIQVFKMNSN